MGFEPIEPDNHHANPMLTFLTGGTDLRLNAAAQDQYFEGVEELGPQIDYERNLLGFERDPTSGWTLKISHAGSGGNVSASTIVERLGIEEQVTDEPARVPLSRDASSGLIVADVSSLVEGESAEAETNTDTVAQDAQAVSDGGGAISEVTEFDTEAIDELHRDDGVVDARHANSGMNNANRIGDPVLSLDSSGVALRFTAEAEQFLEGVETAAVRVSEDASAFLIELGAPDGTNISRGKTQPVIYSTGVRQQVGAGRAALDDTVHLPLEQISETELRADLAPLYEHLGNGGAQ